MAGVPLDSRFVQRVLGGGPVASTLSWEQDPDGGSMTVATDGPDNESVRALVLTIRMFIQDRDGISFGQMREIYDDPSVPPNCADASTDAVTASISSSTRVRRAYP